MKKTKHIGYLVIMLLLVLGCESTKGIAQEQVSAVFNHARDEVNLRGSVKDFKGYWIKNYDPVKEENKGFLNGGIFSDSAYIYGRYAGKDLKSYGYMSFDRNGMKKIGVWDSIKQDITDSLLYNRMTRASIYLYDKKDFYLKKKRTMSKLPFPVYNPYILEVDDGSTHVGDYLDKKQLFESDSLIAKNINRLYRYSYNKKGEVEEMREYINLQEYQLDSIKDIQTRKVYGYSAQGQITSQQYYFIENKLDLYSYGLGDHMVMYTIFMEELFANFDYRDDYYIDYEDEGIDSLNYKHFRNEFTYDEKGNLTSYIFFVKNEPYKKETYHYNDQGVLVSLERYDSERGAVISSGDHYETEYFDQYGNVIKAESSREIDGEKKLRRYEYEYDEYGNWTQCRMYLLSRVNQEEPTAIANRTITYYED